MMKSAVLAIDQGTTGTRAILYDPNGKILSAAYQEFRQYFPQPGWVEHNPLDYLTSTLSVIQEARRRALRYKICAIGITNQRETTILWNRKTGRPCGPAIVWQDRRTSGECLQLKRRGLEPVIRGKTGLVLDPYFSGTKIEWYLNHHRSLLNKAKKGDIVFGTVDSWLTFQLTRRHVTDITNASRTLLFNIHEKKWDQELLRLFHIPSAMLPEVLPSAADFGLARHAVLGQDPVPVCSIMGDQQAALYGQGCFSPGDAKNTYGTGSFIMMNAGKKHKKPVPGLLTTLGADESGAPVYALEGSVFIAGAAIQWLRDGLGLFHSAAETEAMARSVNDTAGVVLIPAFVGLGSPYWRADVRGIISGITRGTSRAHVVRAALESIAHQSADVIEAMEKSTGIKIRELKADGGATKNGFLMQYQADILRRPVAVSPHTESTAWGAAKLAAIRAGLTNFGKKMRPYIEFTPRMRSEQVSRERATWMRQVKALLSVS